MEGLLQLQVEEPKRKSSQDPEKVEPKPKKSKHDHDSIFVEGENVPLKQIPFILSPKLLEILEDNDITELFPVQNQGLLP